MNSDQNNEEKIKKILETYTGTTHYHNYKFPFIKLVLNYKFPFIKLVLTDGAKAVADLCEAYWLIDAISCVLLKGILDKKRSIISVKFKKLKAGGELTFSTRKKFHIEEFYFTTFPLESIEFLLKKNSSGRWVLMLPSEY